MIYDAFAAFIIFVLRRFPRSLPLLCLGLAVASPAHASYIQNRALQPLGEQEAFLANTGVAALGSSGAPFYNPAALMTLESHRLSAEGSVFQSSAAESGAFLVVDKRDLDLKLSGLSPIPAAVMGSQHLWGRPVGFFVLVPDLQELRARRHWETENTRTSLITNLVTKDLWFGGSTAFRLSDSLSLGVSVAGLQHSEVSSLVVDIAYPNASETPKQDSIAADFDANVRGLVLGLGLLYSPSRWWSAGLRVQSPLLRLSGQGGGQVLSNKLSTSGGTSRLDHQLQNHETIRANWGLPTDLLAGVSARLDENLLWLADVGVQLPAEYDPYPDSAFSLSVRTKAAWRVSTGVAWQWTPRFRWMGGLSYNGSSTELVEGQSSVGSTDTPFWGITGGIQSRLGPVVSGFGLFYQRSNGRTASIGDNEIADYRESRLGALLTFSYEFDRFLPRIENTTQPVSTPPKSGAPSTRDALDENVGVNDEAAKGT